jgi:hypothetical protein
MHRAILLLSFCSGSLLLADPPAKPLSDRDLGLSRTSVFEAPAPPLYQGEGSAPAQSFGLPSHHAGFQPLHGLSRSSRPQEKG